MFRNDRIVESEREPAKTDIVPPAVHPEPKPVKLTQYARRAVDVLIVNPPMGEFKAGVNNNQWEMSWPQVALAQLAAMLTPDYCVSIVDAASEGLSWYDLKAIIAKKKPRYYLTQIKPSLLQNGLIGISFAQETGAKTIAFGPYITAKTADTLSCFADLDFALCGEPELTLRELIDTLEYDAGHWSESLADRAKWEVIKYLFGDRQLAWQAKGHADFRLSLILGLAWRSKGEVIINERRPLITNLDYLPLPEHHLLPLSRKPVDTCPQACIVTNRRHTPDYLEGSIALMTDQLVRTRSTESIISELWLLHDLRVSQVHMSADIFTANRNQVANLCLKIISEEIPISWSCKTNIRYVDEALLTLMKRAGCKAIYWPLKSALEQAEFEDEVYHWLTYEVLAQSRKVGIENWGCFILGRMGETDATVQHTVAFARSLPLDLTFFDLDYEQFYQPNLDPSQNDQSPLLPSRLLEQAQWDLAISWRKRAFRECTLRSDALRVMLRRYHVWRQYKNVISVQAPLLNN